jgi:predicted flap endonuclease-1-like 5' DNA nuclease
MVRGLMWHSRHHLVRRGLVAVDPDPSGWLSWSCIINLIFLFLAILGKTTFSAVALQVIVNAAALILALLPSTKAAFRPTLPSAEQLRAAQAQAKTAAASAKTAAVSASAAAAAVAPKVAPVPVVNDLTKIEGIGPKTSDALKAAGVTSYAQLAAMTPEQIRAILTKAGIGADPGTWPKQAGIAAAGQWAELKSYQDTLEGGKAL